ncbi:hypothetical protein GCM10009739_05110 [Microbacterium ulmi]
MVAQRARASDPNIAASSETTRTWWDGSIPGNTAAVGAATYTWCMTPTAAEVLESAKTLSPAERAEIAEELVLTMHADDVDDAVRLAALRAAIDVAVRSADVGEAIRVPAGGTREFVRELGREATRLVDSRTA